MTANSKAPMAISSGSIGILLRCLGARRRTRGGALRSEVLHRADAKTRADTPFHLAAADWADSSGRRNMTGGCDGGKATFGTSLKGQVAVTWSAWNSATRGTPALLVFDCGRPVQRGRGSRRGRVVTGRSLLVPGGGRHATIGFCAIGEAAKRALPDVRRAGGDRAMASAEPWRARSSPPAWTGSVDDLARAASKRRNTKWRSGVSREHCAMAR